jgi:hypothetical protein
MAQTTTLTQVETRISAMIDRAIGQYHTCWQSGQYGMYLYYRPSTETEDGDLMVAGEETPDGYELAMNERVSIAEPEAMIRRRFRAVAGRLPLMAWGYLPWV